MKFCKQCNNILYPVEENDTLFEKCHSCGFSEKYTNKIIDTTIYKTSNIQDIGTKNYLIYDITLPRTIHKVCPNDNCPSRTNKALQEAVFFNDSNSLKLVYICMACNTEWRYS